MSGGVEALRHLELMALNTAQTASAARKVNECVALLTASLTAPPARTYAEAIEDAAKVAEDMPKFQPLPDLVTPAHDEIDDWGQPTGYRFAERVQTRRRLTHAQDIAAAIRLLSQGEKA